MKRLAACVLSLGLVLGISGCSLTPEDKSVDINVSEESKYPGFRKMARIDGATFQIEGYSIIHSEYDGMKPPGKGSFFIVHYTYTNEGKRPSTFDPDDVALISENGTTYTTSVNGAGIPGSNKRIERLEPGFEDTGVLSYVLPSGSKPDALIWSVGDRYVRVLDVLDVS